MCGVEDLTKKPLVVAPLLNVRKPPKRAKGMVSQSRQSNIQKWLGRVEGDGSIDEGTLNQLLLN